MCHPSASPTPFSPFSFLQIEAYIVVSTGHAVETTPVAQGAFELYFPYRHKIIGLCCLITGLSVHGLTLT